MKIGTDFSGIGAPEMALKYLGIDFESVFACEIDKYARKSFEQLHAPQTFYNDITKRNHSEVEQLDLYVAGFPCQSFSMAGKRKGFEETRGTLFFNVAEFIKENKPKCFVLENVKGLLSHDKGRTFQTIVDVLSNGGGTQNGQISLDMMDDGLGYHIYWKVLNTKNFGIPQNRERIFIVGFKDFRDFTFPKEMPLELKLKDILQDNPNSKYMLSKKGLDNLYKNQKFNNFKTIDDATEYADCITARCNKISNDNNFVEVNDKYYLSEKMISGFEKHKERHQEKGNGFAFNPTDGNGIGGRLDTREGGRATNNFIISHCLHTRGSNRPSVKKNKNAGGSGHLSKQDGTTYCLDAANSQAIEIKGASLRSWPRDSKENRYKRLEIRGDNVSNSITTHNLDSLIKSNTIRRLTPLECWRLQGFRDEDFHSVKDLSDTQLYKQAGNSITVDVLMHLFQKIYG